MNKTGLIAFAIALACALPASPAAASPNHTAVSGLGNDTNPCTVPLPCRTLQAAFNVTASDGVIEVMDAAGYGPLVITHGISIQGHGWATLNGSTGAVINITARANVVLQGLIIDGFGLTNQGIAITEPGEISVLDCTVRNAVQAGISITSSTEVHVTIANTVVADNQGDGIAAQGASSGVNALSLDHVQLIHNGGDTGAGLRVTGVTSGAISSTVISSSVISANGVGIVLSVTVGNPVTVLAINTRIVNNQTSANVGAGTFLLLDRTTIKSLRSGITNNGSISSYGNNVISDSITGNAVTKTPLN
jgi:hypothetical protein